MKDMPGFFEDDQLGVGCEPGYGPSIVGRDQQVSVAGRYQQTSSLANRSEASNDLIASERRPSSSSECGYACLLARNHSPTSGW